MSDSMLVCNSFKESPLKCSWYESPLKTAFSGNQILPTVEVRYSSAVKTILGHRGCYYLYSDPGYEDFTLTSQNWNRYTTRVDSVTAKKYEDEALVNTDTYVGTSEYTLTGNNFSSSGYPDVYDSDGNFSGTRESFYWETFIDDGTTDVNGSFPIATSGELVDFTIDSTTSCTVSNDFTGTIPGGTYYRFIDEMSLSGQIDFEDMFDAFKTDALSQTFDWAHTGDMMGYDDWGILPRTVPPVDTAETGWDISSISTASGDIEDKSAYLGSSPINNPAFELTLAAASSVTIGWHIQHGITFLLQRGILKNNSLTAQPCMVCKIRTSSINIPYDVTIMSLGFIGAGKYAGDGLDVDVDFPSDVPFPLERVDHYYIDPDTHIGAHYDAAIISVCHVVVVGDSIDSMLTWLRGLGTIIN